MKKTVLAVFLAVGLGAGLFAQEVVGKIEKGYTYKSKDDIICIFTYYQTEQDANAAWINSDAYRAMRTYRYSKAVLDAINDNNCRIISGFGKESDYLILQITYGNWNAYALYVNGNRIKLETIQKGVY